MNKLTLGISPCPNDTYIFGAMLNGFIKHDFNFDLTIDDVEVLNNLVLTKSLDISKISFGVYPKIKDNYKILSAGAALGFGNGPLIISKNYKNINELQDKIVAIPGANTTANLLLTYFYPDQNITKKEMRFDKIIPAILSGEVDAGLIIHEGRFIYQNYNLNLIADLGNVWSKQFNLPLPLGCIVIKNEHKDIAGEVIDTIKSSIHFADKNYPAIEPFIKKYSAELADDVIRSHISLYVNEYSLDMRGAAEAMIKLLNIGEEGII